MNRSVVACMLALLLTFDAGLALAGCGRGSCSRGGYRSSGYRSRSRTSSYPRASSAPRATSQARAQSKPKAKSSAASKPTVAAKPKPAPKKPAPATVAKRKSAPAKPTGNAANQTGLPLVVRLPQALPAKIDIAVVSVEKLDSGDRASLSGPRYRVRFRNNGADDVTRAFEVALVATSGGQPASDSPYVLGQMDKLAAGETGTIELRLPVEASELGIGVLGEPVPFTTLFVVVDSQQQLVETNEENNALRVARQEIPNAVPTLTYSDR